MEPYGPQLPEAPDEWARMLKEARARRRRPAGQWALVALLVLAVGALMFQVGQAVDPTRPAAARPAPGQPLPDDAVSGYGVDDVQGTAAPATTPAPPSTTPPPPTTAPPPRPRVLKLVTRNLQTEANPNRVYLAPGQVEADQAGRGRQPQFVVRPGQRLQVKVANQDRVIHSFTFAPAKVNLDAWEGTVSRVTFTAPRAPGRYEFYCRYRKIGMSGTLVVRG